MLSLRRSASVRNVKPAPPNWRVAFGNHAPIEVDLGCGRGQYAWERARRFPGVNVVALDIRRKWILALRARSRREGVGNLRAIRCDVSEDLPLLFPERSLAGITVHHPDPWWKKRHHKRRLLHPALIRQLARLLTPGGWVFTQTDVPDLATEIRANFDGLGLFVPVDAERFQSDRLGGIRSHREQKCIQKGILVERMAYVLGPEATP